jgi:ubiquinone/menaquinone biosynthesis C-methylase UbiE
MKEENYDLIYSFENENWWYKGKRDLFFKIFKKLNRMFDASLDLGCGVGSNFKILSRFSKKVTGIDNSAKAISCCREKGYIRLYKMNAEQLKFKDNSFDLVLCSDVLEHINDKKALSEISRILKYNGIFIFSVPAHMYLWGPTDEISNHLVRYEKKQMISILNDYFQIKKLSYWNFLMFFPNFLFIKFLSEDKKNNPVNTLGLIPKFLNNLLFAILSIENKFFINFDFPQGVSIVGICLKNKGL